MHESKTLELVVGHVTLGNNRAQSIRVSRIE